MATTTVTLTDSFQQISAGACFAQVNNNVLFGFGSSAPTTVFHTLALSDRNNSINYNGDFGAIWMKKAGVNETANVIVTVA